MLAEEVGFEPTALSNTNDLANRPFSHLGTPPNSKIILAFQEI